MQAKVTATAIFLLATLCVCVAAQVSAQTYTSGVSTGDYLKYKVTSYWNSTDASLSAPYQLVDINNTVSFDVNFLNVWGVNVTCQTTQYFTNGSRDDLLLNFDVSSGEWGEGMLTGFQGIFTANLTAGDRLRPLGNENQTLVINQTISMDYPSGKREINEVKIDYPSMKYDNSTNGTTIQTLHFDKATGVLVDSSEYSEFPQETGSVVWTLVETNKWSITPAPLPIPIIVGTVVAAVIVVAAVGYVASRRGRRRKKSKR